VIVGSSNFAAFRWTETTGLVPTVSGGPGIALSFAVSADGSVAAGGPTGACSCRPTS
jgi:hypothetical protein